MKIFKKYRFYILFILLSLFLAAGYYWSRMSTSTTTTNFLTQNEDFLKAEFNPETTTTTDEEVAQENLPKSFLIANVPFQTQAPLVNWDELHDEACEEASIILVKYYFNNDSISAQEMDEEILKMVSWQEKNFGGHFDLTVAQTLDLAKSFYSLDGRIIKNANIKTIKQRIAAGQPVIVPTAGRLLGNPNFRSPGPIYHMVVAIGYDEKNIIVQDVGTRNGEHYIYNQKIFENAWHDWTGSPDTITDGSKNLLILTK